MALSGAVRLWLGEVRRLQGGVAAGMLGKLMTLARDPLLGVSVMRSYLSPGGLIDRLSRPPLHNVYGDPSQVYDWPGFSDAVGGLAPWAVSSYAEALAGVGK